MHPHTQYSYVATTSKEIPYGLLNNSISPAGEESNEHAASKLSGCHFM